MEKAHDLTAERRTVDISIDEDITFSDMLLSESTLKGLEAAGFKKPSPIQKKAIPFGRCGFDLIVQAKSGTGKTCVFAVVAMEMLVPTLEKLQVLILAPTREISVQITNVISSVTRHMGKPKVEAFIGGLPLKQDKKKLEKCQIAVGAPGRIKHLLSDGLMDVSAVRLFVLDEADRLMEKNFQTDIGYIYSKLPPNKQMIAASATFPEELEKFVSKYMKEPRKLSPGQDTILLGVRQFMAQIPFHPTVLVQMKRKTMELINILSSLSFKQCLVFSNYQSRAESICDELTKEGWPAIYINGSQTQIKRLNAFHSLKEYRCRVLISTDLTSRGIDAENVNLVINLDLPYDGATYLHRIGRAGRYGTYGSAITILQEGEEVERFRNLLYEIGGENFTVSIIPKNPTVETWEQNDDFFEKLTSLKGKYEYLKQKEIPHSEERKTKLDEKHDSENDKAISVIHEMRLPRPEKLPFVSLDALPECEAGLNDRTDRVDIKNVPKNERDSIMNLENNGWKSFYHEFETYKKLKANKSIDRNNGYVSDVSCESDTKNVEPCDNINGYDEECNNTDDRNEDLSSASKESSETYSDTDDEGSDEEENELHYNNDMGFYSKYYDWNLMWFKQMRLIRQYVQYCHYWKGKQKKLDLQFFTQINKARLSKPCTAPTEDILQINFDGNNFLPTITARIRPYSFGRRI